MLRGDRLMGKRQPTGFATFDAMSLSTDALLRAVIALARDVQRLRTVDEVLRVAGAGLEALGLEMAVWPGPALAGRPRAGAVTVPLTVGARVWGEVEFRHPELAPAHVDILSLFALQLGSVMDLAEQYQRQDRSAAELARTQAELVRHERLAALGELAAVMAHEVRNPLGVIFNSLTTLKRLLRPSGDAEMLLGIMSEEADRLDRIVGDLLDFVKPYELVKRPLQVPVVVTQAVEQAAQALRIGGVRVEYRFPEDLPDFPADAHLLRQALVNLVVNAQQSMPRGGAITISASLEPRDEGAWLRLDFRDEGVGLDARAQEKMFQPFFTTKATGTGLGLAVVKRIIDGHQGEVTATPNPDRGSTFTVRLPPRRDRDGLFTPVAGPAAASTR